MPVNLLFMLAVLAALIWLYLALLRGGFWRNRESLDNRDAELGAGYAWPAVTAVVPARDEVDVIGRALGSLISSDYPGRLEIIVVDDGSSDGTAEAALTTANNRVDARRVGSRKVVVVQGAPLPSGWAGKLWAMAQGVEAMLTSQPAGQRANPSAGLPDVSFVWFTDADIEHDSGTLRRLVTKAEDDKLDLVSQMVLLDCSTIWEKLLIPPFVYFFGKLYPFAWIGDSRKKTAGAAGGCQLVRLEALQHAGGLEPIRGRIIDDCALAALLKSHGKGNDKGNGDVGTPSSGIWLGLTRRSVSIRPYASLADIWKMVARSAYTQLNHSPLLLAGTVLGLALTYLVAPIIVLTIPLHQNGYAGLIAGFAWTLMIVTFLPTLQWFRRNPLLALTLPIAATFYGAMTIDSAWAHWHGRGEAWKGRTGAQGQVGVEGQPDRDTKPSKTTPQRKAS